MSKLVEVSFQIEEDLLNDAMEDIRNAFPEFNNYGYSLVHRFLDIIGDALKFEVEEGCEE